MAEACRDIRFTPRATKSIISFLQLSAIISMFGALLQDVAMHVRDDLGRVRVVVGGMLILRNSTGAGPRLPRAARPASSAKAGSATAAANVANAATSRRATTAGFTGLGASAAAAARVATINLVMVSKICGDSCSPKLARGPVVGGRAPPR